MQAVVIYDSKFGNAENAAERRGQRVPFDTRYRGATWLMGSAAAQAAKAIRKAGGDLVAEPESFFIVRKGPLERQMLEPGEIERAEQWAAGVAAAANGGAVTSATNTITAPARPARRLDRGRVLRLVFGSLGVLAALALLAGGVALTWGLRRTGTPAATSPRIRITTRRRRTRSRPRAST